jgi:hypothetical protein
MKTIHTPVTAQAHTQLPALRLAGLALVAALALAAAGCANEPLKSDKLQLARDSVTHATNMEANTYAAAEMQSARERVDSAQAALTAGDLARANALSDEVLVNTRLAEAKVQTAKSEKAATELQQARRTLQIEIQKTLK